jgi:hypothetical protein
VACKKTLFSQRVFSTLTSPSWFSLKYPGEVEDHAFHAAMVTRSQTPGTRPYQIIESFLGEDKVIVLGISQQKQEQVMTLS